MKSLRFAVLGDAQKLGFSVPEASRRLLRLAYAEKRLLFFCAAHLVGVGDRDLKVYLGRLQHAAASRAELLRRRLRELRTPKVRLEAVPDPALALLLDEAAPARDDAEVLATALWLHAGLTEAYQVYREATNPVADAPTAELLDAFLPALTATVAALEAATAETDGADASAEVSARLDPYLAAAGGWDGAGPRPERPAPDRSQRPFAVTRTPGRDGVLPRVWDYLKPPMEKVDEHLRYMMGIRLSEINVAEGLGVVLCETADMPWEFYFDLSRHLWDEVRHSLMGEGAIEATFGDRGAVPMREYESAYCMEASALEQYATLGLEIEGGQMKYPVGKRGEWEFCRDGARHPLMTTFQDYDWADEVLHVNLAKRQLLDWFPNGPEQLGELAVAGKARRAEVKGRGQATEI